MNRLPDTCGDALSALRKHYKTEEIRDLVVLSGLPRPTLDGWNRRHDAKLNAKSRDHLRRVLFGEAPSPVVAAHPPTVTNADLASSLAALLAGQSEVLAGQTRIEQRLDALLTLRQDPERIEQMVEAKQRAKAVKALKAQGGGAA